MAYDRTAHKGRSTVHPAHVSLRSSYPLTGLATLWFSYPRALPWAGFVRPCGAWCPTNGFCDVSGSIPLLHRAMQLPSLQPHIFSCAFVVQLLRRTPVLAKASDSQTVATAGLSHGTHVVAAEDPPPPLSPVHPAQSHHRRPGTTRCAPRVITPLAQLTFLYDAHHDISKTVQDCAPLLTPVEKNDNILSVIILCGLCPR